MAFSGWNKSAPFDPATAPRGGPSLTSGIIGAGKKIGGFVTPTKIDPSAAVDAGQYARNSSDAFANERTNLRPMAAPIINPSNDVRASILSSLDGMRAAADGTAPSAAIIAGKAAADRAASQQFGQAAALQGALSPGAALRMASEGSAGILGQNANDMAALRATEMAQARGAYSNALSGLRQQDIGLSTDQGRLTMDAAQLDEERNKNLMMGQLQAMGYSVDAAKAIVDAQARQAASENAYKGGIISSVTSLPILGGGRGGGGY